MRKRLLVFAHADEAQAFTETPHLVTGIGKVSGAARLAHRLGQGDIAEVTVLGTAGMIDDALDLDTVYQISAVLQHDFEFESPVMKLHDDGQVQPIDSSTWQSDPQQPGPPSQHRRAIIATGDVFVKDDTLRAQLLAQGANLVDMESYAYATVCELFGVALRIFKIPSDPADSATTHETWDDIVARKSEQLREFARERALL